ncbi:Putative lipid II flippase FtsW [Jeotgalibaca dankookensis]|uniref:Probable peptidoglycan glycosyltransferase FtsW n=1 Tax=Jeotgalibaca dankookensis TaxID=708126 RepID=A0A1S6IMZ5_9LACT|nr:putative peptidoglycan glycosyltransferase FtsW [Jeotgalibaca dankookensis]AQS52907.1 Putative lipid II flippase FtsW [Jeotgalibaca dankookensis]
MEKKKSVVFSQVKEKLKYVDWKLIVPYLVLLGTGLLMVYSSSSYFAMTQFNNSEYFLIRQLIFTVTSILVIFIVSMVNVRIWKSRTFLIYTGFLIFLMLIFLLVRGVAINGASAWINLGFFSIQPSELLKVILILYLGVYLSENQEKFANIQIVNEKSIFKKIYYVAKKPLLIIGLFILLVGLQPDMGGVIIISGICLVMILVSGLPLRYSLGAIGIITGIYLVFILFVKWQGTLPFLPAYMVERFTAFLDPFGDTKASSFQLVNSFYALARGGLFGVGIGHSVQKTGYLPESYTDFIIPIMAEELGLIRVIIILMLFFYIIYRIFKISLKVKDSFGQLVTIGIGTMFLIQGTINVGGAIGILPLTGVTFPFVSYGGSSLLVSTVALAIVNNIYINDQMRKRK